MAGGNFTVQNKVRPGLYINVKARPDISTSLGERGVVAMPVSLSWGAEKEFVELTSGTVLSDCKKLAGFSISDAEAQLFREVFKGATKLIFYRVNSGTKATGAIGNISVEAKYSGAKGNEIVVSVAANGDKFDVVTTFAGTKVDTQTVGTVDELVSNDYIVFSGEGDLEVNAGVTLDGGSDSEATTDDYDGFFSKVSTKKFNVLCVPNEASEIKTKAITAIKYIREGLGKYCQAVLVNSASANYEGVISVSQGYKTETETVSVTGFAAYVAGITAGATVADSNTYRVVNGAIEIVGALTDAEIETALKSGKLVLSTRQDGKVVIEKDINTLVEYGADKNYSMTKNKIIRILDETWNKFADVFEKSFLGKVPNNKQGRSLLKSVFTGVLLELQKQNVIQNFDSDTDIAVLEGQDIDVVVCELAIQPVDAMEKLYVTALIGKKGE